MVSHTPLHSLSHAPHVQSSSSLLAELASSLLSLEPLDSLDALWAAAKGAEEKK